MSCLNDVWDSVFQKIIETNEGILGIQDGDIVNVITKVSYTVKLNCMFNAEFLVPSIKQPNIPGEILKGTVTVKKGGCGAFQDIIKKCIEADNSIKLEALHLSKIVENSIKVKKYKDSREGIRNKIHINVLQDIDIEKEYKQISELVATRLKENYDDFKYSHSVPNYTELFTKKDINEKNVWECLSWMIFSVLMSVDYSDSRLNKEEINSNIEKLYTSINNISSRKIISLSSLYFELSGNLCDEKQECLSFYRNIFPKKFMELSKKVWGGEKELYNFLNEPLDAKSDELVRMRTYFSYQMEELHIFINNCKDYVENNRNPYLNKFIKRKSGLWDLSLLTKQEDVAGEEGAKNIFPWILLSYIYDGSTFGLMNDYYRKFTGVRGSFEWIVMPFYMDKQAFDAIFPDETRKYIVVRDVKKYITENLNIISLDEWKGEFENNEIVALKGSFKLEDLYYQGKRLVDFQKNMFDFLDINPNDITYMFNSVNSFRKISMNLGGDKVWIAQRHLMQTIFMSDRIFSFELLGRIQHKIGMDQYSLKPYAILYV